MPNPIRIEERYQELHAELESAISIRYSHALVAGFLRELEGEYSRFSTYVAQISEKLKPYEGPLTWSGLDPTTLESQIALFEHVAARLGDKRPQTLYRIFNQLKAVCLLLYGCLGERSAADRHLKTLSNRSLFTNRGLNADPCLLKEIDRQIRNAEKETREVRWIKEQLLELLSKKKACLLIPVAELYRGSYPREFGRLRCLQVELFGEAEDNDELAREYRFIGAEEPIEDPDNEALKAARNLFEKRRPGVHAPPFRGAARYELSGGFHDGRSSDLAVAGLWYTRMEEATARRIRFTLNPDAAVTGRLNREGKVETVDEETIRLKAQAAFFSWAEMLVVPSAQKRAFESHLSTLKKSYPGRNLFLMEAENLNDLFYDRRLAEEVTEDRIRHAIRKIGDYRFRAVGIPLVIILIAIIFWLIYGPIDQNPVDYRYEGNSWVLENQFGQEVKRIPLSDLTINRFTPQNPRLNEPTIQLFDIDNDGVNDVVYGESTQGGQYIDEVSKVKAYSVAGDSVIWERTLELNYDFPRQSGVTQQEMLLREIQTVKTQEGTKLVMNANSFYYFPAVVFLMDPATGRVEAEYLHIGHLRDMLIADHNGDGKEEVILLGISNAFWRASLAVLDPDRMHGHSPLTQDYKPDGLIRADEQAYITIPKTIIGKYTDPIMKYNEGMILYSDMPSNTIRAQVEEGRVHFAQQVGNVILEITFDQDYKPVGVGTSDIYDIVARDLYENDQIPFEPDFDYFEAYQDSILYWSEGEFVRAGEFFGSDD